MKTQISILALSLLTLMNVACGKKSGSSEVSSAAAIPATSAVTITVSGSPSTVVAGGQMVITPSGGTAPYTFVLTSGSSGSISSPTGNYTTYTAAASGTFATVMVTDANNHSVYFSVPLVASPTTTPTTATGACSGVFNADIAGSSGTMYIVSDASGNFAGSLAIGTGTAALAGSCVNGNISFANQFSGSTYTGTYATNANGKVIMTGSFTTTSGSVYMWSASQQ